MEFVLGFKEIVSRGLKAVQATAHNVFTGIGKDAQTTGTQVTAGFTAAGRGVQTMAQTVQTNVQVAQRALSSLTPPPPIRLHVDTSQAMGAMGELRSSWSVMRGTMMGEMAVRGIQRGIGLAKEVGMYALGAGADAEQQIVGLSTFIGKAKAKPFYEHIQERSAQTPFTTAAIMPQIQMLVAQGKKEGDAEKVIWNLMNAISATGHAGDQNALSRTGSVMAKAAGGKVSSMELRELNIDANLPMAKLLADYKNVPLKKAQEWMSEDAGAHFNFNDIAGAFDKAAKSGGMFANALEEQAKTLRGKWSTIEDWWNVTMAKLVLKPGIHDALIKIEDDLTAFIKRLPDIAEKYVPAMEKVVKGAGDMVVWVGSNLHLIKQTAVVAKEVLEAWLVVRGIGMIGATRAAFAQGLGTVAAGAAPMMGAVSGYWSATPYAAAGAGAAGAGEKALLGGTVLAGAEGITLSLLGSVAVVAAVAGIGLFLMNKYSSHADINKGPTFGTRKRAGGEGFDIVVPRIVGDTSSYDEKRGIMRNYKKIALDTINRPVYPGIDKWAAAQAKKQADTKAEEDKKGLGDTGKSGDMSDVSESITGGGRKQIIIHVKSFAEKFIVHAGNLHDAAAKSKEEFERMFLEVLQSAAAAL